MRRRHFLDERLDGGPKALRVVAILVAGTLIAGVAAWLAGVDPDDGAHDRAPVALHPANPLLAELIRCNGLGQAALVDVGCRAVWAENRRRFFASGNRSQPGVNQTHSAPASATPGTSSEPPR